MKSMRDLLTCTPKLEQTKDSPPLQCLDFWFNFRHWKMKMVSLQHPQGIFLSPVDLIRWDPQNAALLAPLAQLASFEPQTSIDSACVDKGLAMDKRHNLRGAVEADDELASGKDFGGAGWISSSQILHFSVQTPSGKLGKVTDIFVEGREFSIRYFLVQDERWSERYLLVDPEWIEEVHEKDKSLSLSLAREVILLEAVFDPKRITTGKRYEIDV